MKYDRANLKSTISAAIKLATKLNAPVFVVARAGGFHIEKEKDKFQPYYEVTPKGALLHDPSISEN